MASYAERVYALRLPDQHCALDKDEASNARVCVPEGFSSRRSAEFCCCCDFEKLAQVQHTKRDESRDCGVAI